MVLLPILILAAQAAPNSGVDLMAVARDVLGAEPRCVRDPDSTDITVCGLRRADRYRVPFIVHDPGDPQHVSVAVERETLLHRTTPVEDMSPFLVESGMVGVEVGTSGGSPVTVRKPAP